MAPGRVEVLDIEGSSCVETELEIKLAGLANGKDAGLRKRESQDHTSVLQLRFLVDISAIY